MFTHRNNEQNNERGALMIEAIALLGLMTMMSPMIVRQTADRTAEMEEVAIAGQMKEIKDALSNWIEANYQEKAKGYAASNTSDASFAVSASDLAPYLPSTYLTGTGEFKGNKLVDGFNVGVRAQCTEAKNTANEECGTRTNGTITGLSSNCKCSRYKMTGVVLSKTDDNAELDDRRAARIASMIGADGGYMRTAKMINAVMTNGSSAETELKKIIGSQGIWEGDVSNYFNTAGWDLSKGGRIAATTIYSSGFSGDYLYRKKVDGLPGANSMFTDLDMGGATNCNEEGCYKINNAGGLEVIGGKILIRSENTEDNQGMGSGNSYARIALATDSSHMKVTNSLDFVVSSASNVTNVNTITSGTRLSMNNSQFSVKVGSNTSLNMASGSFLYNSGSQMLRLNNEAATFAYNNDTFLNLSNAATLAYNSDIFLNLSNQGGYLNTALSGDEGSFFIDTQSGFAAGIQSSKNIQLDATKDVSIYANNSTGIFSNRIDLVASNDYISPTAMQTTTRSHLSINNSNASLIGGSNVLIKTGRQDTSSNTATAHLAMGLTNFSLVSNLAAISSNNNQLNLEVAAGRTASGYHNVLLNNRSGIYLNQGQVSGSINNNVSSFALTEGNFMLNIGKISNTTTPAHQVLFNNTGLFVTHQTNSSASSKDTIASLASIYTNRAKLNVNADTGAVTNSTSGGTNARVTITTTADTSSSVNIAPYYEHSGDTKYDHFRIDPSFISVMNDIKITSRGGARISESLPNYILKGIYELSNSYGSGPWPCDDGSCSYVMPRYSLQELGLSAGGWEFHCDSAGAPNHPIKQGGGTCSASTKYVTFSQYKGSYQECSGFCWAHPFMGAVPAPGRSVSVGNDNLAAYDEGVCPDGYQAVMTVTPTVFELGKVQMISSNKHEDAVVTYNPGWQNYADQNIVSLTGLLQASTRLGMLVEPIVSGTTLNGWKIAMGTVTLTSGSPGYIWNAAGIPANTWSAIVHTYCYFNPGRFEMPNMIIKNSKWIQAADNPNL